MVIYSLILGFAAWGFSAAAIAAKRSQNCMRLMAVGFLSAAVSAMLPFYEIRRWAYGGDFAAIEDTISGFIFGVAVMLGTTLMLDLWALMRKRGEKTA